MYKCWYKGSENKRTIIDDLKDQYKKDNPNVINNGRQVLGLNA